jgi:hypothetical protein
VLIGAADRLEDTALAACRRSILYMMEPPMTRLLGSLALIGLTACSSHPMPVLLQGEPVPVASLGGDWSGQYSNGTASRHGSLKLFIGEGADSTFGDVTMIDPLGERLQPADDGPAHRAHTRLAQVLRVDLMRDAAGAVTGTLEPYIEPECLCTVSTTFTGSVLGDTLRGTFVTRNASGEGRAGQWKLVRRSAPKH